MYRYDGRVQAARSLSARSRGRRQATLIDYLQPLLGCACALLPGGALVLSGQGNALSPVFHPLVDALHIPLEFLVVLMHPVILVIDGRQRHRAETGAGFFRDERIGGALRAAGIGRAVLRFRVRVTLWQHVKRACFFGVSYFGTAWCLLLTLTLAGYISWSDNISAGARLALALLVALHIAVFLLASGVLLLGKLRQRWDVPVHGQETKEVCAGNCSPPFCRACGIC